jgi:hypothetical protein
MQSMTRHSEEVMTAKDASAAPVQMSPGFMQHVPAASRPAGVSTMVASAHGSVSVANMSVSPLVEPQNPTASASTHHIQAVEPRLTPESKLGAGTGDIPHAPPKLTYSPLLPVPELGRQRITSEQVYFPFLVYHFSLTDTLGC